MASADAEPLPALYLPHAQKGWHWMSWLTLMVRAEPGRDPRSLAAAIRSAVWELDGQLPIQRMATAEERYGASIARRSFAMTLIAGFAAIALLLGTVGMYGVLSYTVAQRRQEFGIRIALGAGERRVVGDVLGRAMRLAVAGVAIGTVAALALTRLMESLLYGVSPTDPPTFAGVAALLTAIAALAAWVPARRATRIDPLVVIRDG
jgi:ABC-type antimicrobial peptide transport system permease subunit